MKYDAKVLRKEQKAMIMCIFDKGGYSAAQSKRRSRKHWQL
jgi:hypothetical protein